MKKRILSLALALLLACALTVPASASFDTGTRESVAVLYTCLDVDAGETPLTWGTCFFVGEQGKDPSYLITNYHVIDDFVKFGSGELRGYRYNSQREAWTVYEDPANGNAQYVGRSKIRVFYDSGTYEEAYVVEYNEIKDVALLKLAGTTSLRKPIPLAVPDDSMVGSTIYAVGYPGLSENLFAGATTAWGISDVTVTRGAISRLFTTSGTGQQNIQIDCDIRHGNSGGPLINESGAAIGINYMSVSNTNQESANYAVNISEAITLLSRNGVAYDSSSGSGSGSGSPVTQPPSAQNPASAAPTPEPTTEPTPTPAPTPAPEPSEEPAPSPAPIVDNGSGNILMIALIAVAAVAVIAIAAAVLLRKKKDAAPPAPPQPPIGPTAPAQSFAPPQPPKSAIAGDTGMRLQGVSGSFAGRRIAITRQLRIGRDPQRNDLVYPAGTQGISGVHCVLLVENGTVYLKDLGSTYGTFVGGRKLAANETVTLRVGDRFSLGSERETFQIAQKGGV